MALTKEEMRQKLLELSERDRDGLAEALQESLVEKREAEGIFTAERLVTETMESEKPN